ncbi:hypothetical protein FVE85_8715 [Porphyridium purpureum]|uniref:Uncharacterized protein n=1 Tax=Porphyridium purpureum TaxID=35688 RepID=A0A5J4YQK2_PORPP|nr:hypothetical protein FVE85_8715 [Porphyridium purpureum]|eukprot:POR4243..scf296_7
MFLAYSCTKVRCRCSCNPPARVRSIRTARASGSGLLKPVQEYFPRLLEHVEVQAAILCVVPEEPDNEATKITSTCATPMASRAKSIYRNGRCSSGTQAHAVWQYRASEHFGWPDHRSDGRSARCP